MFQRCVLTDVQGSQSIVLAVQGFQRKKDLYPLQRRQILIGYVNGSNIRQFLRRQHAVGTVSVDVGRIFQPAPKSRVGKHRLGDGHVLLGHGHGHGLILRDLHRCG